jgi:guanylate kinase
MSGPTLIAITGPSGFKKRQLVVEKAIKNRPDFITIVSHTDRPKFDDETDGEDFHFVSEEEFTSMIEAEKFLEWQRLLSNGFRYGKTKAEMEKAFANHPDKIIFTYINVINLPVFKRYYPDAKSIFIDVKDTIALIDYLKKSPDVKSEEEFERRYKFATEERRRRHLTDYTMNMKDSEEETVQLFLNTVEKCKNA